MTLKRAKGRILALFAVMVAFLTCMTTTPAFAANTPVSGGKFTFNKYLVMDKNVNVPPVTFTFTIRAGTAVNATADSPAIYAGIMVGDSAPSVSKAGFSAADSTTDGLPTGGEETSFKYATKKVTVDLSGVTFSAPGIYRYVIEETASTQSGIANDQNATRCLDVLVTYVSGSDTELKVSDYSLHDGNDVKSDGFTNTYTTYDLTLEKTVTGNQGDRDKYFQFTVVISGAAEGTKYSIDLPIDGHAENPRTLTAGVDERATGTFYLKHGQSIVIHGLTEGTQYTITETDYTTDGYTTTNTDGAGGKATNQQAMGAANHVVTFTNNKDGAIPTGILLETGPYLIMGAVVVVGLVALVATRRRRAR